MVKTLQEVRVTSKYTTEVRFICEQKSGLDVSSGANNIDSIINRSWDKIFTTRCVFFDEEYRRVLCCKILKHFYLREIGAETVGIWTLWMNTKLEEIMPYYNQLYASAKLEFNPFNDVDLTRQHKRDFDGTSKSNDNGKRNASGNVNGKNYRLYSDTPQGALTGVENENYLTNATKETENTGTTTQETTESSGNTDTKSQENFIETIKGKQGTENYSSLLQKYRETFLNIDMQVINEFEELFMGLW